MRFNNGRGRCFAKDCKNAAVFGVVITKLGAYDVFNRRYCRDHISATIEELDG